MSFSTLGLAPELLRAVSAQGYTDTHSRPARGDSARARRPRPARRRPDRHRQDGRVRAADAAAARGHAAARTDRHGRAADPRPHPGSRPGSWRCRSRQSVRAYGANSPPLDRHLRRRRLPRPGRRAASRAGDRGRHAGPAARPRPPAHHRPRLASRSSSWTRPIACSTWASSATSARSWPCCPTSGRTCSSAPPSRTRSAAWPRGCSTDRHRCRSRRRNTADRPGAPGGPPGRPLAQARAAVAPGAHPRRRPGARLHPHQARRQQARRAAVAGRHRHRRDPRQQVAAAAHPRPRRLQGGPRHAADRDRGRRSRP